MGIHEHHPYTLLSHENILLNASEVDPYETLLSMSARAASGLRAVGWPPLFSGMIDCLGHALQSYNTHFSMKLKRAVAIKCALSLIFSALLISTDKCQIYLSIVANSIFAK